MGPRHIILMHRETGAHFEVLDSISHFPELGQDLCKRICTRAAGSTRIPVQVSRSPKRVSHWLFCNTQPLREKVSSIEGKHPETRSAEAEEEHQLQARETPPLSVRRITNKQPAWLSGCLWLPNEDVDSKAHCNV